MVLTENRIKKKLRNIQFSKPNERINHYKEIGEKAFEYMFDPVLYRIFLQYVKYADVDLLKSIHDSMDNKYIEISQDPYGIRILREAFRKFSSEYKNNICDIMSASCLESLMNENAGWIILDCLRYNPALTKTVRTTYLENWIQINKNNFTGEILSALYAAKTQEEEFVISKKLLNTFLYTPSGCSVLFKLISKKSLSQKNFDMLADLISDHILLLASKDHAQPVINAILEECNGGQVEKFVDEMCSSSHFLVKMVTKNPTYKTVLALMKNKNIDFTCKLYKCIMANKLEILMSEYGFYFVCDLEAWDKLRGTHRVDFWFEFFKAL